ncbi:AIR synthase related protein [Fuchsiella alkaliacetigena]|uniref:AIR synthase related protein n=1 Tax=Fuchsiella alkaliacetigena TaxID=957042 RepID=UPI00200B2350|nr:AIR synthase related protein [Fuchsiella alkaliacetigena]MCK8823656.1 AIR synthase related protein [Fuchsiella alkaliacetigena]
MNRDISLIELNKENRLVVACDSLGGIGPKEGDALRVEGELVGKLAVRVALMEVLAVRARPISVINTLCVEKDPTGQSIIAGIEEEVKLLDVDIEQLLNGSTEENVATIQTGVGITVIGVAKKEELRLASSAAGAALVAVGLPKVAKEVLTAKEVMADLEVLQQLLSLDYVQDILPVGSKGIKYEAELLAKLNQLRLELKAELKLDLEKSAGPATVLLITLPANKLDKLEKTIDKPLNYLGKLAN